MARPEKVQQGKNIQRTALYGGLITLMSAGVMIAALGLPHGASADKAFGKAAGIEQQAINFQGDILTPEQQHEVNTLDNTGNHERSIEDRYFVGIGASALMLEVGFVTAFVAGSRMEDRNLPPAQEVIAGAGPNPE